MRARRVATIVFALLATTAAMAQNFGRRQPSVTYEAPPLTSVDRGHLGGVNLQFRVAQGYHINSNQPKQDYLKKTELHFDAPTDIAIVGVTYPEGTDRSFPFAPNEKLNVYTGDFNVRVLVRPLKTVLPTRYAVHGFLKYQACDNAACYPPKQLPISFEIKVLKGVNGVKRRNPAQSPHVHR